ncbi:MAG: hypothetical protein CMG00_00070 [Candidatus Marinimicrobia bacterium]|nr:hypothetical protein [Candidatus Neomarinimicrobiota bacterium]|tara:strand:- start:579 stop:1175 length:597 start_codon:yes stop_codon:yes gene_type:complete
MFKIVKEFEKRIAEYYNAPFAIATDSCTHALELSLRYDNPQNTSIIIPARTYISVPFTLMKLNIQFNFSDYLWQESYFLGNTRIVDAAVCFKQKSYVKNQLMCLSFQFKKMLNLGRGGAILCSTKKEYDILKKMSYDGRSDNEPWAKQNIDTIGYHYYMTPETAQLGIDKLKNVTSQKIWSSEDYPYLPNMKVFNIYP